MKVALGSDHRGDDASRALSRALGAAGHDVTVLGPCDGVARDYPDTAYLVASAVASGSADRGVLLCSNGIGMSIAANKVRGVRAALVYTRENAERSRRHNDANVLCLPGEGETDETLEQIARLWLETPFEGGRHQRRVDKIAAIEAGRDPSRENVASGKG